MKTIPKMFTRDFPIVLLQIWGKRYVHMYGQDLQIFPRNINVCSDGLSETYRDKSVNQEINSILLDRIKQNPNFIADFLKEKESAINRLEAHCYRGTFSREQFLDFLDLLHECWEVIYIGMYVPGDERFLKTDRDAAMTFRASNDQLEYKFFNTVGTGLAALFPSLGSLAHQIFWQEIVSSDIPNKGALEARRKRKLFVVDDQVLDESGFEKLKKDFDFTLEEVGRLIDVEELKGQVACPGKVRGEVQILMRAEEVPNFVPGRILVSSMTVPTFLPAMHKASAFVTDEGGITCHAAIVAREMKKPCVIGTKIATKVLKNGDMVEVDADNGVVKIIKNG